MTAIIKIIKNSKDTETAKKNLLNKKWPIKKFSKLIALIEKKSKCFKISTFKHQVDSILELRLQKLTAFGINEIEDEIKDYQQLNIYFNKILKSKKNYII